MMTGGTPAQLARAGVAEPCAAGAPAAPMS